MLTARTADFNLSHVPHSGLKGGRDGFPLYIKLPLSNLLLTARSADLGNCLLSLMSAWMVGGGGRWLFALHIIITLYAQLVTYCWQPGVQTWGTVSCPSCRSGWRRRWPCGLHVIITLYSLMVTSCWQPGVQTWGTVSCPSCRPGCWGRWPCALHIIITLYSLLVTYCWQPGVQTWELSPVPHAGLDGGEGGLVLSILLLLSINYL